MYKLPYNKNGPIGEFYRKIDWFNYIIDPKTQLPKWNLIRINTPGGGNCLFHAIANSFFSPYYSEKVNEQIMTRKEIIRNMRKSFSEKLNSPISSKPNSKTHYEIINSGNTAEFPISPDLPEYNYSLSNMQKSLDSEENIGYGYIEFISNAIDKNIYILVSSMNDIYPFEKTELLNIYKKDRPSIVVYYIWDNDTSDKYDHYELVGIMNKGTIDTHFMPDHSFIKFLYNKVLEKSK